MTKIVINCNYGGFQLTRRATEMIAARGNDIAFEDLKHTPFYGFGFSKHEYRTDPDLIAVIEQLGNDAADGCDIRIVEIPDDVDWYIYDYDGYESIHEVHRIWGGDGE